MSETNNKKAGQKSVSASKSRSATQKANADRVAAVKNARTTAGGQSGKRTAGTYRRRKRRRQSPDFAKILLILIGIVIAVLCVAVGLKGCAKDENVKTKDPIETKEPETEIHAEIIVNGISVNGLTKSEAMEKILADLGWNMQVTYNGESKPVDNMMYYCVDHVLEEALNKGDAGTYSLGFDGMEEQIAAEVENLAAEWDVQPKNGSINAFDRTSGEFKFADAENGRMIEREALAEAILKAIKAEDYDAKIEAAAKEVPAEISREQAKASFKRIGTYTTTTTNNKARNENVRIASEALNGLIIQPGEEFSFNLTTGNRTPDKGYQPAGAYVNGVLVEEPGGGVCQVSSTLYNAVVFAGLKTTERHAHSYEPSYVTPGEDAMVSYDGHSGPDMKFINNSSTAIGIKTSFANQKLTVSVYGSPILEEGVTLSMVSTKTKDLDPPAPVYEEDQTLQPGVEVEAKAATLGSRWATSLVTKKDGVVISEIHFHNSTYKGKSATIKRNTSGVVIPAETQAPTETESAAESAAATETTGAANGPGNSTQAAETRPAETKPAETTAPAPTEASTAAVQNPGPADVNAPSSGSTGGPGSSSSPAVSPQNPAGISGPSGVTPQSSGGPSGQPAETSAGPGNIGLIAPIG